MVQKLRLGDANSRWRKEAYRQRISRTIAAYPLLDIIGGGHYANKPELVEAMVRDAPDVIKWHETSESCTTSSLMAR